MNSYVVRGELLLKILTSQRELVSISGNHHFISQFYKDELDTYLILI
jgi:hypothetical protein